jgi:hypothetical protein
MKDYSEVIKQYWPTIIEAWDAHCDKHPIIECNLARHQVLAFPAKDYINTLSERTRLSTLRQYQEVVRQGGMMLFVKDARCRILQSYIFLENDIYSENTPRHK